MVDDRIKQTETHALNRGVTEIPSAAVQYQFEQKKKQDDNRTLDKYALPEPKVTPDVYELISRHTDKRVRHRTVELTGRREFIQASPGHS